jgi:hypothetical protein
MKTKISLLTIAAIVGFCSAAFAGGNSVSISVSCTIPEIPGVNAPYKESQQVALLKGADTRDNSRKILVKTFYPR